MYCIKPNKTATNIDTDIDIDTNTDFLMYCLDWWFHKLTCQHHNQAKGQRILSLHKQQHSARGCRYYYLKQQLWLQPQGELLHISPTQIYKYISN